MAVQGRTVRRLCEQLSNPRWPVGPLHIQYSTPPHLIRERALPLIHYLAIPKRDVTKSRLNDFYHDFSYHLLRKLHVTFVLPNIQLVERVTSLRTNAHRLCQSLQRASQITELIIDARGSNLHNDFFGFRSWDSADHGSGEIVYVLRYSLDSE